MDPNTIFSLFDSEPENRVESPEKEITNLSEHPYVLMGLFTRMILRGEESIQNTIQFLKVINIDSHFDFEANTELSRYMLYTAGFNHLSKLSLEDPFHRDVLLEKAGVDFLSACNKAIQFFQIREEYEKCALIKKFSDFTNFSQNKLPL
jgi:hypothetical protein